MNPLWRNRLIAAAVVLAALAAAFSAGRFSAPMRVETRETERLVYRDRVVEKIVTVTVAAKTVYVDRVIDRVTTAAGTVTERITEKTATKADATVTANASKDTARASDSARESVSVTTNRPGWRVGILAGAALQQPLLPIAGPLTLGVHAERRIIGGVWIGAWTLPQSGAVGASVALEF